MGFFDWLRRPVVNNVNVAPEGKGCSRPKPLLTKDQALNKAVMHIFRAQGYMAYAAATHGLKCLNPVSKHLAAAKDDLVGEMQVIPTME